VQIDATEPRQRQHPRWNDAPISHNDDSVRRNRFQLRAKLCVVTNLPRLGNGKPRGKRDLLDRRRLDDLLSPDALVVVEWGEKFKSIRKRATGEIVIASEGGDARKITVTLKE